MIRPLRHAGERATGRGERTGEGGRERGRERGREGESGYTYTYTHAYTCGREGERKTEAGARREKDREGASIYGSSFSLNAEGGPRRSESRQPGKPRRVRMPVFDVPVKQ